ncbi:helicase-related protein [Cohnella panacarvi]|uniref:helicase-related protein n=1 Tax=Cohnella panacarvi TaxID=400776 RepID=UPI00047CDEBE|nr:helicase-related protein [Cohnella panacarvi]
MKAILYAVKESGRWTAEYSIAWDADANWLGDRGLRGESIVMLTDKLSLGMAELACERMNAELERSSLEAREVKEQLSRIAKITWAEQAGEDEEAPSFEPVEGAALAVADGTRSRLIAALAREAGARLAGRALLEEEALQLLASAPGGADRAACYAALQRAKLAGAVRLVAAVAPPGAASPRRGWGWLRKQRRSAAPRCRRCGSGADNLRRTPCAACEGHACAYCEACLTMGRSRACGLLVIGAAPRDTGAPHPAQAAAASSLGRWRLSPAQREAAAAALRFLAGERGSVRRPGNAFLLWAVTGAGKTEMIFPLLEAVLSRGGRALVATPRRDVVLELAPRLAAAFPGYSRSTLYGGSADRWENSSLTLATTHQLIRFQAAFDLVLIDEMDAFPYKDDQTLQFAAAKCCKPGGATLYLSATPPPAMQREAARRRLPCARVPVRYHGNPLPVPECLSLPSLAQWTAVPKRLANPLKQSVRRGAQLFLFVPKIRHVEPLVRLLRRNALTLGVDSAARIEGTSSKDSQRADKVSMFRERAIRILVTTTILERGITIPKSDVYVLDADDPLFDAAALVQMAGRAGRSADDPNGMVCYAARRRTAAQQAAVRQIRGMNRLANKLGYLHRGALSTEANPS